MKRKIRKTIVALFVLASVIGCCFIFTACSKEGEKEIITEPYGEIKAEYGYPYIDMFPSIFYAIKNESDDEKKDELMLRLQLSRVYYSYIDMTVYDSSMIDGKKIVFVKNLFKKEENPIVVSSKWLYYSWVLQTSDTSKIDEILREDYTMEKISLLPETVINNDRYRENVRNGGELTEELTDLLDKWENGKEFSSIGGKTKTYVEYMKRAEPVFYKYKSIIAAAALVKYGCVDLNEFEMKKINLRNKMYRYPQNFTVVGYIESDFDGILGTGVSMDPDSEDYKAVCAGLQDIKAYSIFGNIFEK